MNPDNILTGDGEREFLFLHEIVRPGGPAASSQRHFHNHPAIMRRMTRFSPPLAKAKSESACGGGDLRARPGAEGFSPVILRLSAQADLRPPRKGNKKRGPSPSFYGIPLNGIPGSLCTRDIPLNALLTVPRGFPSRPFRLGPSKR
jgi:hypothetical protein